MNKNFEEIINKNKVFINIIEKVFINNFTESQFLHIRIKKIEEDIKAKKIGIKAVMSFDKPNSIEQDIVLIDKNGVNWKFLITNKSVEIIDVAKIYGEYLITHNKNISKVTLNKTLFKTSILEFNNDILNKEQLEIVMLLNDKDMNSFLNFNTVEGFIMNEDYLLKIDKYKNKTIEDSIIYKIKNKFKSIKIK